MGLLLPRAEHSAGLDVDLGLAFQSDVRAQVPPRPVLRLTAEDQSRAALPHPFLNAGWSDAWACAPPLQHRPAVGRRNRASAGVAAGKLAGPALDGPALDGVASAVLEFRSAAWMLPGEPAPDTRVAAQFAARSCGAEALRERVSVHAMRLKQVHPALAELKVIRLQEALVSLCWLAELLVVLRQAAVSPPVHWALPQERQVELQPERLGWELLLLQAQRLLETEQWAAPPWERQLVEQR